ncbi:MAG: PD-(D/E)XK nuclease family protein [Pseudomonadota bacterium]
MLEPAIAEAATDGSFAYVVTSGQRLANSVRTFQASVAGSSQSPSWCGPSVVTWSQFVRLCYDILLVSPDREAHLPILISTAVEQVYWRRSVARSLTDLGVRQSAVSSIARECARTANRMAEWQVDAEAIRQASNTADTDFFVRCARTIESKLESEDATTEGRLANQLIAHASTLIHAFGGRVAFAGFNRLSPQQSALAEALRVVPLAPPATDRLNPDRIRHFETPADELRAAGRWAREYLDRNPSARLAIVVPNLSERVDASRRDVLDGLLPNACYELADRASTWLSVSMGQAFAQVPAVADAMQWLRFVRFGGSFDAVSHLNRCGSFSNDCTPLERALRATRDREWQAEPLAEYARRQGVRRPTWLNAVTEMLPDVKQRLYPSQWSVKFASSLRSAGWLERSTDDSIRFQLKVLWEESLDALTRLDNASGPVAMGEAVELLDGMLSERVFAPEQPDAPVLLCGPIETTGLAFDAIWVSGLDSVQWPPPGRPLPLVALSLQREHSMPDATPDQTRIFWSTQWQRIRGACNTMVASHAAFVDGRERLASPVIVDRPEATEPETVEPASVAIFDQAVVIRSDEQFPPWPNGHRCSGGHQVLSKWAQDPFAAQVIGRWNLRPIEQPVKGLDARTRGILVHRSLEILYADGFESIVEDPEHAVAQAVEAAFRREFVGAEPAYRAALREEEARASALLSDFVVLEAQRSPFDIAALEARLSLTLAGIEFQFRADRIDTLTPGALVVDYKTGARDADRTIAKGDFDRITQLAVYALASATKPAAVGLATIHPRRVGYRAIYADGAERLPGDRGKPGASLESLMPLWEAEAARRAASLAAGQAWLNLAIPASDWLPFGVLSRMADVRKHG